MARITSLEKPRNSAARIVNVLIKAMGQSQTSKSLQVWSTAFGLDSPDDHQVAELLTKLRRELQAVESGLQQLSVPEHLFRPSTAALAGMFRITNLSQSFVQIAHGAAEENVMALRWAAFVLPEEEHQIDAADLNELKQLLAEFEVALGDAILPPALKAYLEEQVAGMKAAIASATVSGTSGIRSTIRKAFSEAQFSREEFEAEADSANKDEIKKVSSSFSRLFKKGAEVAGDFEKYEKVLKLANSGVSWIMDHWNKLPPPGGNLS